MKDEDIKRARERAYRILQKAGVAITPEERENMEVADFGLNDLEHYGIEVIIYENNDRYCAKELVLFPRQICPEHRHPPVDASYSGKQETFRCRWGEVYLYIEGEPAATPKARIPEGDEKYFRVRHEIVLKPGGQFTLPPDHLHWFQAGDQGAVLSEFSTPNTDEYDIWTNPEIRRTPTIESGYS
jgi:D-lyxose ketol-isomerase